MGNTIQLVLVAVFSGSFCAFLAYFMAAISQKKHIESTIKTHVKIHHKQSWEHVREYVDTKTKKIEAICKLLTVMATKAGMDLKDIDL